MNQITLSAMPASKLQVDRQSSAQLRQNSKKGSHREAKVSPIDHDKSCGY